MKFLNTDILAQLILSKEDRSLVNQILDSSSDAIVVSDNQGYIELFNRAAQQMFGYTHDEIFGQNVAILMPDPDRKNHHLYIQHYHQTKVTHVMGKERSVLAMRRNGELFNATITISELVLGGASSFTAIIHDESIKARDDEKITSLSYFDETTNLPNIKYLEARLESYLRSTEGNHAFVAAIDLGNLHDLVGQLVQKDIDQIRKQFAQQLLEQIPRLASVVVINIHQFKLLFIDQSQTGWDASEVGKRIYRILNNPVEHNGHKVYLKPSVGVVKIIPEEDMPQEVLEKADLILDEVIKQSDSHYGTYKKGIRTRAHRHSMIVQQLYDAVETNPFKLWLQPQYDLHTGEIIGVETLIRWPNEQGEWLSPGEFIPIAEKSELIRKITYWTVEEACRLYQQLSDHGFGHLNIGVNISAQVIGRKRFADKLISIVNQSALPLDHLDLEITETSLMMHVDTARDNLQSLFDSGVQISLDDFGTGQSSLSYLSLFKISRIKIDQLFVKESLEEINRRSIVESIITLSHKLGYKVIAEGVEQKLVYQQLKEMHCDQVQGNYLAYPMPVEALLSHLIQHSKDKLAE